MNGVLMLTLKTTTNIVISLTLCALLFLPGTTLTRSAASSAAIQDDTPAFNLVSDRRDPNGFLFNPQWSGGRPDPGDRTICPTRDFQGPKCSTQPTTIDVGGPLSLGTCLVNFEPNRVPGHVNWTTATYDGTICFGSYNSMSDGDYTFELQPTGGAGLTSKRGTIHTECDAYETFDHFRSPLWSRFKNHLQGMNTNKPAARRMINGRRAIITGLVGLDTEHGGYSELHPIYMLAIETKPDPQDNVWMIFIRTWGNEGWCSKDPHPIVPELTDFRVLLPFIPNSHPTGVETLSSTRFFSLPQTDDPVVALQDGGALVTFHLRTQDEYPKPLKGPLLEGELHLRWALPPGEVVPPLEPQPCEGVEITEEEDNPARKLGFSPAQIARFNTFMRAERARLRTQLARLRRTTSSENLVAGPSVPAGNLITLKSVVRSNKGRVIRSLPFEQYESAHQLVINALCNAAPDRVRGFDCRAKKPLP